MLAKLQGQDVEELGKGRADAFEVSVHLRQGLAFEDTAFLGEKGEASFGDQWDKYMENLYLLPGSTAQGGSGSFKYSKLYRRLVDVNAGSQSE